MHNNAKGTKSCGKIIRAALFVAAGAVFAFSFYKLMAAIKDQAASDAVLGSVNEYVQAKATLAPAQNPNTDAEQSDIIAQIEEYAPISVDFDALLKENGDIRAWIYCPDTVINYPIVQAENNEYYLHRLLDGQTNRAGTIFIDCRCAADMSGTNTIIYGHNMKNGTMFGTLDEYKQAEYYAQRPYIYLLTPHADYKLELIAGSVVDAAAPIFAAVGSGADAYSEIAALAAEQAYPNAPTISAADKFVTLSTCTYEYDNARYIIIAKLTQLAK